MAHYFVTIMEDLLLFDDIAQEIDAWKVTDFSAENKCQQKERLALENRYWGITEVTDKFNRQSVSYQLSKKDCIHGWLKYKEGFSAALVKQLLIDFNVAKGDLVIDPFMGSGTTALVSTLAGINSIGYDVLPMSAIAPRPCCRLFSDYIGHCSGRTGPYHRSRCHSCCKRNACCCSRVC